MIFQWFHGGLEVLMTWFHFLLKELMACVLSLHVSLHGCKELMGWIWRDLLVHWWKMWEAWRGWMKAPNCWVATSITLRENYADRIKPKTKTKESGFFIHCPNFTLRSDLNIGQDCSTLLAKKMGLNTHF